MRRRRRCSNRCRKAREGSGGSDQFLQTSAVNLLAACIYFFVNYEKEPYDADGNKLYAEMAQDPKTKFWKPTGVVRDRKGGNVVEPAYWLGKYSDMPHILSFLNENYQTIFEVLETDNGVAPLLGPFQTALKNKAMEQLEGMSVRCASIPPDWRQKRVTGYSTRMAMTST